MEEIPAGRVASYGQIARLIGLPTHSRLVGRVLSQAELYGDYPCHRALYHAGALAASFAAQRELLEAEGVEFRGERLYEKAPLGVLRPNRRSLKHGIYGSFEAQNFKLSAAWNFNL